MHPAMYLHFLVGHGNNSITSYKVHAINSGEMTRKAKDDNGPCVTNILTVINSCMIKCQLIKVSPNRNVIAT